MVAQRSTSCADTQRQDWDVVVIGAGPAGSLAAKLAASNGLRTLLVEAKEFPRPKVCGGCLNDRAIQILRDAGVMESLMQSGAVKVERIRLACGSLSADWKLGSMIGISRWTMDPLLANAAVASGATFLPQTTAHIESELLDSRRVVRLTSHGQAEHTVRAKVVVAASGLTSSSMTSISDMKSEVAKGTRIGVGALLESGWGVGTRQDTLTMAVSSKGYVGLACVESGRLNMAAAVDADALRTAGSISKLVTEILRDCNIPIPQGIDGAMWLGTPALTRRRVRVAAERLLVLGDAAGYIEPFTGEGMTWALQTASLSAPLIQEGCQSWSQAIEEKWGRLFLDEIAGHQWMCRGLSQLLRKPKLARVVLRVARCTPWLAQRVIMKITGPSHRGSTLISSIKKRIPQESHA